MLRVTMSDGTTRRDDGAKHQGPASTSPYPVSRLAPTHDLVDVAREIATADRAIGSVVGGKLELIAEQIRALQSQAQQVLESARRDLQLHRADCNFVKRVGATYHLYERPAGRRYLSMLSPEDWSGTPPHCFIGSFRLEPDQSWSPAEDVRTADPDGLVARLLLARVDDAAAR